MTRLVLLVMIAGTAATVSSILIVTDWFAFPPDPVSRNDIDRVAGAYPGSEIGQWTDAVQKARGALLTDDDAVATLADNKAVASAVQQFAGAFHLLLDQRRQIEQFRARLSGPEFHAFVAIFARLHQEGKFVDALRAPRLRPSLDTNLPPDLQDAAKAALGGLREPFDDFFARRAAILAASQIAPREYEDAHYPVCAAVCRGALRQFQGMPPSRLTTILEVTAFRAEEQIDWAAATDASLAEEEKLRLLQQFVTKYQDPRFVEHASHISEANALLPVVHANVDWQDLLQSLPTSVVELIDSPTEKLPSNIDYAHAIRKFHEFTSRNPSDTSRFSTCRTVSTRLLFQWFSNDLILKPRDQPELWEITIRRSGAKYVGTTVEQNGIVAIQQPGSDRVRKFFLAALVGKPELVEEFQRERSYRDLYQTMRMALPSFDWSSEPFVDFVSHSKVLKFDDRAQAATALLATVQACPRFQIRNVEDGGSPLETHRASP